MNRSDHITDLYLASIQGSVPSIIVSLSIILTIIIIYCLFYTDRQTDYSTVSKTDTNERHSIMRDVPDTQGSNCLITDASPGGETHLVHTMFKSTSIHDGDI